MDLNSYVRAIRAHWLIVVVSSVLGLTLGAILGFTATPVYSGSVTFFATTPSSSGGSALQGLQFGQQRVNTYVKLLNSDRLAKQIVQTTTIGMTVDQVRASIHAKSDLNTVLLTAIVHDSSPERTLALTSAVAREFPALVQEIESVNGAKEAPLTLDVVSGPSAGSQPVSPNRKLGVMVGLLLGLAAGVGLAIVRGVLDRSVRTEDGLRDATKSPVLGTIPFDAMAADAPLILNSQSRTIRAEAYRQLRTNLQFVDAESPVSVLVVTSATPSDGKTSTATNLALTFSDAGRRVLLIDADLRRPRVAEYLGLENAVGLTNVLAGQVDIHHVMQKWGETGLTVLGSGSIPPNPSELLGSHHMTELIETVRREFDLVIIDTPPLMPVTDAAIASTKADGAVLVVRYGKTRTADVERALDSLRKVDARVLGTILNRTPSKGVDAHHYGNYEYRKAEVPEARVVARPSAARR